MRYKYKPDDHLPQVGDVCKHESKGLFIVTHIFTTWANRNLGYKPGYSYHLSTCKTLVTRPGSEAKPGDKVIYIGNNGEAIGRANIGEVYTVQKDTDNEYIYWHPTNEHYCRHSNEFLVLVQENEQTVQKEQPMKRKFKVGDAIVSKRRPYDTPDVITNMTDSTYEFEAKCYLAFTDESDYELAIEYADQSVYSIGETVEYTGPNISGLSKGMLLRISDITHKTDEDWRFIMEGNSHQYIYSYHFAKYVECPFSDCSLEPTNTVTKETTMTQTNQELAEAIATGIVAANCKPKKAKTPKTEQQIRHKTPWTGVIWNEDGSHNTTIYAKSESKLDTLFDSSTYQFMAMDKHKRQSTRRVKRQYTDTK